jgi:phosphatidylinositol-3-phosphatase
MKQLLAPHVQKALAAAASLTGKKFTLLVASSLVATTGILAAALGGSSGMPLSAAAARALLGEDQQTVAAAPASSPEPATAAEPSSSSSPATPPSAEAASSGPLPPTAAPAPEANPAPEAEEPAPPAPEEEAPPEAGPVKHVFLVSLASPGYEAAFGSASQMPYLASTLRPQGVLLSRYGLLDDSALANGLAAIGGEAPTAASKAGCPDYEACISPVETFTVADQLGTGQLTWRAYLEGMSDEAGRPANCVHPEPGVSEATPAGGYSATLNPFVYFHSLLDLGDCASNDVPLTELPRDLRKPERTANFSYVSPDLCDAGFPGQCPEGAPDGAAAADAFLANVIPEILASPAYKQDGLLIVTFGAVAPAPIDPTVESAPEAAAAEPLKTGALLISRFLAPGGTDAAPYDPYSLLRSTEDLFGLAHLGEADGAKVRSFASAITAENGGD